MYRNYWPYLSCDIRYIDHFDPLPLPYHNGTVFFNTKSISYPYHHTEFHLLLSASILSTSESLLYRLIWLDDSYPRMCPSVVFVSWWACFRQMSTSLWTNEHHQGAQVVQNEIMDRIYIGVKLWRTKQIHDEIGSNDDRI